MRDINRAIRGVSPRERSDILATLVEGGDIVPVGQREGRLGRPRLATSVHRDHLPQLRVIEGGKQDD